MINDSVFNSAMTKSATEGSVAEGDTKAIPCVYFQCPFGCSAIYPTASINDHMMIHFRKVSTLNKCLNKHNQIYVVPRPPPKKKVNILILIINKEIIKENKGEF